jgi:transcriptional regulator of acetoin/glycerol metabolism
MSVAQTTKHHADQVQATVARGSAATSAVVASWRRSSNFHRLDPAECSLPRRLSQAEFELARQQIEPLVRAAQSNLDRLFLAVGGVGCCVLLADRNGVPVDRRGAVSDDETFKAWDLWTATVWSEECEGTNGIGTCLAEQRALTVHRDQHFYAQHASELHIGADLRSRGQASRGARRILLPCRPYGRIRQSHCGCRR